MAIVEDGGVNHAPQAEIARTCAELGGETTTTDYHVRRYRDYLRALAALAARPDDMPDAAFDAMSEEADDIFDDLMEGSANTVTGVMLKARAAHHWAMQYAQGSVMSPRTFATLFGIIAADLEVLTASGRAVQS